MVITDIADISGSDKIGRRVLRINRDDHAVLGE
jgi:hypothetical protein